MSETNAEELALNFGKNDSIELKMNAKQECSWNIKLRFDNESQGWMATIEHLEAIHNALKEKFL